MNTLDSVKRIPVGGYSTIRGWIVEHTSEGYVVLSMDGLSAEEAADLIDSAASDRVRPGSLARLPEGGSTTG